MTDTDPITRTEYEARHSDLDKAITALAESVKTLSESITTIGKETAELRGWLKGTSVAVSIVTAIVLSFVAFVK